MPLTILGMRVPGNKNKSITKADILRMTENDFLKGKSKMIQVIIAQKNDSRRSGIAKEVARSRVSTRIPKNPIRNLRISPYSGHHCGLHLYLPPRSFRLYPPNSTCDIHHIRCRKNKIGLPLSVLPRKYIMKRDFKPPGPVDLGLC